MLLKSANVFYLFFFIFAQLTVFSVSENTTRSTMVAASGRNIFPRRALDAWMLHVLKTNATKRQVFCQTCKPRNCRRPILKRRCAHESSKAKKCACCNFCPGKWRKAKVAEKMSWRSEISLEEVIAFMKKKLPRETSAVCHQYRVHCSAAQLCLLNIQNLPVCRCLPPSACGRGTMATMVCASNGQSYLSRCHLLVSACRMRAPLRAVRPGPCRQSDAGPLLEGQMRLNVRRKWRRRHRKGKRREKRRRFTGRLIQLIESNQRERRRLLREMKRLRRLQRSKRHRRYLHPVGRIHR